MSPQDFRGGIARNRSLWRLRMLRVRSCGDVLELSFRDRRLTMFVEQRRGCVERQLAGLEVRHPVGKRQVLQRHRAPRDDVDPDHDFGTGNARVDGTFDPAYQRLIAADPLRQVCLAEGLLSPPFDQAHRDDGSEIAVRGRYVAASSKVNGHVALASALYADMAYRLLVMRPGNRLREMRVKAKVSQKALALATGVTQGAISNLENGKRALTVEWMRAFARALGCAPADLLDEQDNPYRLQDDEREFVRIYRAASAEDKEKLQRVTEALVGYRAHDEEERAA